MRPKLPTLTLSIGLLLCTACGGSQEPQVHESEGPSVELAGPVADAEHAGHTVLCGCIVDGVGMCGNYIEIAGEPIPLKGEIGLGEMEFCGEGELRATVDGEVVEGEFVATSFELLD